MSFDLGVIFPDPTTEVALADPEVKATPEGDGEIIVKLLRGNAGFAWKGLEKLIQSVVIDLWSDPLPDGSGAGLRQVFNGGVRDITSMNVRSIVAQRVEITRINMVKAQAEPGPSLQLDEILSSLAVIDVRLFNGFISIDLLLETGAGDSVAFTSAVGFV